MCVCVGEPQGVTPIMESANWSTERRQIEEERKKKGGQDIPEVKPGRIEGFEQEINQQT